MLPELLTAAHAVHRRPDLFFWDAHKAQRAADDLRARPLVVHRMDIGDLPFRYVGKHSRASLKDVLALKERTGHSTMAVTDDGTGTGKGRFL